MFRSSLHTSRSFVRGVRFNSTSSGPQGFINKIQNFTSQAVYWTKVVGEVSKQVWLKEKLSPPTFSEFQSVYESLYVKAGYYAKQPNEALSILKSLNKNDLFLYGSYFIQIVGLFSLGEIVGRRQIVNYPNFSAKH